LFCLIVISGIEANITRKATAAKPGNKLTKPIQS
jgi:hypothetical protein